jgi:hypothetical protein
VGAVRRKVDYNSCPSLDTLNGVSQVGDDYNPALVDWRSIKKSIEYLAGREPRFCNFAIRAFFHDSGATAQLDPDPKARHRT